jgi:FlaG/FlaF family flagellin (archaellin)
MKTRIARALMVAIVAGLLAIAGTAPFGQPGTMHKTQSIGGGA